MELERLGAAVAEGFETMPPFDEAGAFGRQALKLGRFHLGAVLFLLQAVLRHFVAIKQTLCAGCGAVEQVDLTPEQFLMHSLTQ